MLKSYKKLNDNDELIDVEVNLDLLDELEESEKKSLLWLFVKDEGSIGHSTCRDIHDVLIRRVTKELRALYAGQKNEEGWCEFYFYAYSGKKFASLVREILSEFGKLTHEVGTSKDNRYEHYYYKLYPSEYEFLKMRSDEILKELRAAGDDSTLEREVEHYLLFQTASSKERFIKNHDFEKITEFENEDEYAYGVTVVLKHDMSDETIDEKIKMFYEISLEEHASYELYSTTLKDNNEQI